MKQNEMVLEVAAEDIEVKLGEMSDQGWKVVTIAPVWYRLWVFRAGPKKEQPKESNDEVKIDQINEYSAPGYYKHYEEMIRGSMFEGQISIQKGEDKLEFVPSDVRLYVGRFLVVWRR